tara:strand:- start:69 stop:668 length:600 start_codon:yes stop_codon:yes gene_type:complete
MTDPQQILDFWFGTETDDQAIADAQASLWWAKSAETDARIQRQFETTVQAAAEGMLDEWSTTAQGRLALILLTDQFPRNIYRDTPLAFGFDSRARQLCIDGLDLGHDQALRPIERVFFYLPLEHSESRDDQALCVALMRQLIRDAAPVHRTLYEGYLDFAVRHQVIVDRFGRFPHRNRILGRADTAEERAFLQQPGNEF